MTTVKRGNKVFPRQRLSGPSAGCSDKSQKIKNSVTVIRSDQDEFLHATRETEISVNSEGCQIFLQNLPIYGVPFL